MNGLLHRPPAGLDRLVRSGLSGGVAVGEASKIALAQRNARGLAPPEFARRSKDQQGFCREVSPPLKRLPAAAEHGLDRLVGTLRLAPFAGNGPCRSWNALARHGFETHLPDVRVPWGEWMVGVGKPVLANAKRPPLLGETFDLLRVGLWPDTKRHERSEHVLTRLHDLPATYRGPGQPLPERGSTRRRARDACGLRFVPSVGPVPTQEIALHPYTRRNLKWAGGDCPVEALGARVGDT